MCAKVVSSRSKWRENSREGEREKKERGMRLEWEQLTVGKGTDGGKTGMKEKEGVSGMRVKSRKVLGLSSNRRE